MPLPWNDPDLTRFVEEAVRNKTDSLKLSEALSKGKFAGIRGEILDYIPLVPKYRKKFNTTAFLACDKLSLEQSTAADIGKYKAGLFRKGASIDDLCCGMGGDSFFLPKEALVRGFDLSESRTEMYRFNTSAMGCPREASVTDVRILQTRSELFTIDPARRKSEGDNQRNFSELTPTLSEIVELSRFYKGGMAKLPPGYPTAEFPENAEAVYLGAMNDCRECLLLFGDMAKSPGKTSAVAIDSSQTPHVWRQEESRTKSAELPVGPLSAYIAEPIPVLIRSHLFAETARKLSPDAHLISPGIAYVSNSEPLRSEAFRNFRVLGNTSLSTGKVKRLLREHGVGKLTLKKRGVEIVPEAEIRRLFPKGDKEGVLFYTRIAGEKAAILAEAL